MQSWRRARGGAARSACGFDFKPVGRRGAGLVGCSHGVAKSRTRLRDFTFTFPFHALEKEMATHSSVLAWRIPGTGEFQIPASSGLAGSRAGEGAQAQGGGGMVAGRFGVNLSPFATSLARGSRFPVPSLGRRVRGPRPTAQRLDTPQGCTAPQKAPPKSRGSQMPRKRTDGGA